MVLINVVTLSLPLVALSIIFLLISAPMRFDTPSYTHDMSVNPGDIFLVCRDGIISSVLSITAGLRYSHVVMVNRVEPSHDEAVADRVWGIHCSMFEGNPVCEKELFLPNCTGSSSMTYIMRARDIFKDKSFASVDPTLYRDVKYGVINPCQAYKNNCVTFLTQAILSQYTSVKIPYVKHKCFNGMVDTLVSEGLYYPPEFVYSKNHPFSMKKFMYL